MSLREDVQRMFVKPPCNFTWGPSNNSAEAVTNDRGCVLQCVADHRVVLLVPLHPQRIIYVTNLLSLLLLTAGWKDGDKWLTMCFRAATLNQHGGIFRTIHQGTMYEFIVNRHFGIATLTVDTSPVRPTPATSPEAAQ